MACLVNELGLVLPQFDLVFEQMRGLLAGFFLSLCILLLSGYGIYTYSWTINSESSDHANVCTSQHDQVFITGSSSYGEAKSLNKNFTIEIANVEEEEDELVFSKKYFPNSNFFTAIFYVLTLGYFFHDVKKGLPSCKHFSYLSSDRSLHLLFRVIRI